MGRALFAFAGNDATRSAASVTVSASNSLYPATNLLDTEPQNPSIATSTTATWVFYMGAAVTPVMVAGINYNWNNASAVTFGNSMGFVTSLTNNARELDGHCPNTWKTLSGANRTSSIFFLTVTGANTFAAVGAFPICTSYAAVPMAWGNGNGPDFSVDYPDVEIETFSKAFLQYSKGIRQRTLRGTAIREDGRSILHSAAMSAHGRTRPMLVIANEDDVTSAAWMRFAHTVFRYQRTGTNVSRADADLIELCNGLPL